VPVILLAMLVNVFWTLPTLVKVFHIKKCRVPHVAPKVIFDEIDTASSLIMPFPHDNTTDGVIIKY